MYNPTHGPERDAKFNAAYPWRIGVRRTPTPAGTSASSTGRENGAGRPMWHVQSASTTTPMSTTSRTQRGRGRGRRAG